MEKLQGLVTSIVQKVTAEKLEEVKVAMEQKFAMDQKVGMDRLQELQSSVEQEACSAAARAVVEQMIGFKEAQLFAMRTRHDELLRSVEAEISSVKVSLSQRLWDLTSELDELRLRRPERALTPVPEGESAPGGRAEGPTGGAFFFG